MRTYTREDLESLRQLRNEIETLRRIRPKPQPVVIFYKDYRTGKGIPKSDIGIDEGENERRELARVIRRKEQRLLQKVRRLEAYLDRVQDPTMRSVLRMYYSDGMSQEEIGEKLGYSRQTITHLLTLWWGSKSLEALQEKEDSVLKD